MNHRRFWILIVLLAVVLTGHLFAAGTPAGTVISNTAYGGYSDANGNVIADVDNAGSRISSNTVTTTVVQVYGLDVSPDGNQDIIRNGTVTYGVTVENTGNGSDTYGLSQTTTPSGASTFTTHIYHDTDRDGVWDGAGTEPEVASTGALAADSLYYLVVVVGVTDGAQGESAETVVTGTSSDGSTIETATLTSTVQAALITGTLEPDATTKAPNATITYTAIITNSNNTNSDTAYDVTFTMPTISGDFTWAGNVMLNGVSQGDPGAGGTLNIGNMAVGESDTLTFQVTVDSDASAGATLDVQVDVDYDDSTSDPYTQVNLLANNTTGGRVTVSQDYSFSTDIDPTDQSSDPGDVVRYLVTVNNTGNGADTYTLSNVSSTEGWTWAFYIDADDNDTWDGTETLTTSTGSVASGASQGMWAVATITAGTADAVVDTSVFRATSSGNATTSDETAYTTVTAPILTLVKAVAVVGGGDPVPDAILRYTVTVTNSGSGAATNVVVKDAIPANTTYQDDTMYIGGVLQTEEADSPTDESTCDGTTAEFGIGNLAGGANVVVRFDVEID
ncbi:DUF11 domain-containing protein [bacterium]|nr:DUF11 domain-containing protein [bacterium]